MGMGDRSFRAEMASAALISGTATRTISHPAAWKSMIWAMVASTSQVLVLHMDCTVTAASPPTATFPTMSFFVCSRFVISVFLIVRSVS